MILQNNIPICFAIDEKFAHPCAVSMTSIILNSKNCKLVFYVLDGGLKELSKKKLLTLVKLFNSKITFIKIDNKQFQKFYLPPVGHFNYVNYYRLLIPSIVKKYKKIIYLDADVIVKKNINKLYETDISNHFLAGVKSQTSDSNIIRLNMSTSSSYINSGVLLFNSEKWRKENIDKKLFNFIRNNSKNKKQKLINPDQDAINIVLNKNDNIKFLSQKWNAEFRTDIKPSSDYQKIIKNSYIIHYLTADKPWLENSKQNKKDYVAFEKEYYNLLIRDYLKKKKNRKSKIIIYTAITGNYDNLIQHKHISMDFDYVCFTDQEIKNPGIWKIDKLKNIDIDDTRKARYHKIFPNKILSKYDYSIWIDANIDVLDDSLEKSILNLIKENALIGVVPHFERNCIYQEGKACIDIEKESSEIVLQQMAFLKKENYPKNNGLYETNILFRKHNEKLIFDTMDDWWQMVKKFSKRDQLSFNYVLWKNNLVPNMLLSKNARLTDSFDFRPHNITVTSTLYLDKTEVNDSDKFIQKSTTILNNNFEVNFEINISTKNDFVLFNLFKNYYAKIKIEKVIYDKNDTQLLNKVLVDTNGKLEEDGYFDFSSSNPIFVFKKPKSVEHISIIGKILPFSIETKNKQLENKYAELETTYSELAASHRELQIKSRELETKNSELESNINKINSLFSQQEFLKNKISNKKVEIFQLEKDLNKIKSAKFFKLWQGYNKIKKIF